MTIEELLDLPAEGLESLSDEELVQQLSPYFKFTRPAMPILSMTSGKVLKPTKTSKSADVFKGADLTKLTPERLNLMRDLMQKIQGGKK